MPEAEKQARWDAFMQLQQAISAARLTRYRGQTLEVLVDQVDPDGAVARSYADAPEIDGLVYIKGPGAAALAVGEFCNVTVRDTDEYDLHAVLA